MSVLTHVASASAPSTPRARSQLGPRRRAARPAPAGHRAARRRRRPGRGRPAPTPVLAEVAASGPDRPDLPAARPRPTGSRAGDTVRAHRRPAARSASATPLRGRVARRPRPARRRRPLARRACDEVAVDTDAAAAPCSRPRIDHQLGLGVRAMDALTPLRPRPAPRHHGRLRRRQVEPALDGRPRHRRRGLRDRPGRRAWPRGARVHRERPRPRGPGPLRRRRRHLRRPAGRAAARRVRRHPDRRVVPRRRQARRADDGQPHPRRHGPARDRPVGRRAARHPRLPAQRLRPAAPAARARRHARRTAASPGSTPSSSRATTCRTRSATPPGRSSTATSCCPAGSRPSGHFPSIDVLESISRVTSAVTTPEQRADATRLRRLMAAHRDVRELVEIGAYVAGADADADAAHRRCCRRSTPSCARTWTTPAALADTWAPTSSHGCWWWPMSATHRRRHARRRPGARRPRARQPPRPPAGHQRAAPSRDQLVRSSSRRSTRPLALRRRAPSATFLAVRAGYWPSTEARSAAATATSSARSIADGRRATHWQRDQTRLAAVELLLERRADERRAERARTRGRELDDIATQRWQRQPAEVAAA